MANSSTLDDPRLVRFLAETAEKHKIQYQFRQPGGGGTNAGAIQQTRAGVPVVSVSVPHRYTHSPISISRVEDWKNTLNLLYVALNSMELSLVKSR
jgi:endoglucanase